MKSVAIFSARDSIIPTLSSSDIGHCGTIASILSRLDVSPVMTGSSLLAQAGALLHRVQSGPVDASASSVNTMTNWTLRT